MTSTGDSTPASAPASPQPPGPEPEDSPQRRLVESVAAYEVDPPPPARARTAQPPAEGSDLP